MLPAICLPSSLKPVSVIPSGESESGCESAFHPALHALVVCIDANGDKWIAPVHRLVEDCMPYREDFPSYSSWKHRVVVSVEGHLRHYLTERYLLDLYRSVDSIESAIAEAIVEASRFETTTSDAKEKQVCARETDGL